MPILRPLLYSEKCKESTAELISRRMLHLQFVNLIIVFLFIVIGDSQRHTGKSNSVSIEYGIMLD